MRPTLLLTTLLVLFTPAHAQDLRGEFVFDIDTAAPHTVDETRLGDRASMK